MEINGGKIIPHNSNVSAAGGTELMAKRIATIRPDLLAECQIINSRVTKLDPSKIRILVLHDLPEDPESEKVLRDGGWEKFHKLVFVSYWQMNGYIQRYNIPWSKCIVLQNAIEPIEEHEKPKDKIRLCYFSTPHRGLNILVPVFERLAEEHDNIELDVFSSFKLYGWEENDSRFEDLFERCRSHDKINYHGAVSNKEIREYLKTAHILAYPSIWQETSCLVLIEAMSAGLVCVHPNYGALSETAYNWTMMYHWNEDLNQHAGTFYHVLKQAIQHVENGETGMAPIAKKFVDTFHSWEVKKTQWEMLIQSLLNEPREIKETGPVIRFG